MMDKFNLYFLDVIKGKYADFKGRTGKKDFWMFILFSIIINILLSIIDNIIGMQILSGIFGLAVMIPSLAIGARRLHDIGKSGWLQLLAIIPLVGIIILIIWWVKDGEEEDNNWGAVPVPAEVE